jgi:trigger factor
VTQAQSFGVGPEEFLRRTHEAGQLGAVYADVRRVKALASVVRLATVTDPSGATVDLAEFLGDADDAKDDVEELEDIEAAEDTEDTERERAGSTS